ncbi:hypothetical protein NI385_04890 [Vibrio parahaemolyticus]|uniref:hypothetical protein n=1 Tax=Vibrio harveyi group TaxID=717610 RepID=UPI0004016C17|nr:MULTISPECIES: hypothetical protein [Vibrio harveyi group]EIJ0963963.1 hypothetical protein [Vibrio parahaemolyticus]EIZ1365785.1 hypothetical protein [Vibrio parahaemolyticus]EKO5222566.1 hypothetical protein [Vibrio parahaemolyticus]ELX7525080.1 hypothetical protein [Vibrio parahaemolyticus]KOE10406.1 hypothetical protein ACS85_16740 [Vibrio parahaemolyticus]
MSFDRVDCTLMEKPNKTKVKYSCQGYKNGKKVGNPSVEQGSPQQIEGIISAEYPDAMINYLPLK